MLWPGLYRNQLCNEFNFQIETVKMTSHFMFNVIGMEQTFNIQGGGGQQHIKKTVTPLLMIM